MLVELFLLEYRIIQYTFASLLFGINASSQPLPIIASIAGQHCPLSHLNPAGHILSIQGPDETAPFAHPVLLGGAEIKSCKAVFNSLRSL